MSTVQSGQQIVTTATYQARGFRLAMGEAFPADPTSFDRTAHEPRLVPVAKGQRFPVLGVLDNQQVWVRAEHQGAAYACLLLADSFQAA